MSYISARDPSLSKDYSYTKVRKNLAKHYDTCEGTSKDISEETVNNASENNIVLKKIKGVENLGELYEIENDKTLLCRVPIELQHARNVHENESITRTFKFSKIIGPNSNQTKLFDEVVKGKVLEFINGSNCTLMSYGASGSGKTFTIVGTSEEPGIIPRSLEYLFRTLPTLPEVPLIKPNASGGISYMTEAKCLKDKMDRQILLSKHTNMDCALHKQTYKSYKAILEDTNKYWEKKIDELQCTLAETLGDVKHDIKTPEMSVIVLNSSSEENDNEDEKNEGNVEDRLKDEIQQLQLKLKIQQDAMDKAEAESLDLDKILNEQKKSYLELKLKHEANVNLLKRIWPYNPEIFPDHLFSPAQTTDRVIDGVDENSPRVIENTVNTTSKDDTVPTQAQIIVRPIGLSPVSCASQSRQRKRNHEGSQLLKSSPYLEELKVKAAEKKKVEERRAAKRAKKYLYLGDDASDEEPYAVKNDHDQVAACLYCNGLYSQSRSRELWMRCMQCSLWAHGECAGLSARAKTFVCEVCQ
ncbi:hypothetical protein RN001_008339 [Aquatica leii]|uniref:Kinesin motor domain-containing protein n=1 Tax=Aquatica leii TaxID=1421715 RepID=A0AAN7PAL7_9COLE|nr:hypothetical protein RN001_008339 [Aquatica leii]